MNKNRKQSKNQIQYKYNEDNINKTCIYKEIKCYTCLKELKIDMHYK